MKATADMIQDEGTCLCAMLPRPRQFNKSTKHSNYAMGSISAQEAYMLALELACVICLRLLSDLQMSAHNLNREC